MKTSIIRKSVAAIAAASLIASATSATAANRTLILLQENSGELEIDEDLSGPVVDAIKVALRLIVPAVDFTAESSESAKFAALRLGHYQRFVNLSDANCTRTNLLNQLIQQSKDGFTVDLAVLGHGNENYLALHGNEILTGTQIPSGRVTLTDGTRVVAGGIRTMLTDARTREGSGFNFRLRLVHMCNCHASTLNDDWIAVGAKVSVGARQLNWMPEPMNTSFWNGFLNGDRRVTQAVSDSFNDSRVIYQVIPGFADPDPGSKPVANLSKLDESVQVVAGDGNLIFKDECRMPVNAVRTVSVMGSADKSLPGVFVAPGERYAISAIGVWQAGPFSPLVTAAGEPVNTWGGRPLMALRGERFRRSTDSLISGSSFSIGASSTVTAAGFGFLNLLSNDSLRADNGGGLVVTVKRVQ